MPATMTRRRLVLNRATRRVLRDPSVTALCVPKFYDPTRDAALDLSGNGFHLVRAAAGAAPTRLDWAGSRYAYLSGIDGNYLSCPDSAALSITGDIDLMAYVAMDDWTPTVITALVGKWLAGTNQRSYGLDVLTTGELALFWSTTGAAGGVLSAQSTVATGITDGQPRWVRATMDVNDGGGNRVIKFYTSADSPLTPVASITWTQLGTTVATAGATSIFDGTALLEVGSTEGGTENNTAMKVYRAVVRNGYDGAGTVQADVNLANVAGSATNFTEGSANAATCTVNRSASGKKTAIVTFPIWLLGTDDYGETADHPALDQLAGASFTALILLRYWGTSTASMIPLGKRNRVEASATVDHGWIVRLSTSGNRVIGVTDDGATAANVQAVSTAGTLGVAAVRRKADGSVTAHFNTATASGSGPATDLSNAIALRVGHSSTNGAFSDMEYGGHALFRRALTDVELTKAMTELQQLAGAA